MSSLVVQEYVWASVSVTLLIHFLSSPAFLLPWSMLPDVIDEDELLTGKRSEGSFYSIFILIQKLGAATV